MGSESDSTEESPTTSDLEDLADGWFAEDIEAVVEIEPPSIYDQLLAAERRTAICTGAGILESCMRKMWCQRNDSRAQGARNKIAKKQKTSHPALPLPPPRITWTRPHYATLVMLRQRALDNPQSFAVAPVFGMFDDTILDTIDFYARRYEQHTQRLILLFRAGRNAGRSLYLDQRGISDSVAIDMFGDVQHTLPHTTKIFAINNPFKCAGAHSLGALFARRWEGRARLGDAYKDIANLSLSGTQIGAEGAVAILSSLRAGRTGERATINMANIGLCGARDGKAVAHALMLNATHLSAERLDFGDNDIGPEGFAAFADAARYICGLCVLILGRTDNDADATALKNLWPRIATTTTIVYAGLRNDFDPIREYTREVIEIQSVVRKCSSAREWRRARQQHDDTDPYTRYMARMHHITKHAHGAYPISLGLDIGMHKISFSANASFTDVWTTLMTIAQVKDPTAYIAPAGAQLTFDDVSHDVQSLVQYEGVPWVRAFSTVMFHKYRRVSGGLMSGGRWSSRTPHINLLAIDAGESRRRAALVYAASATFPLAIIRIIAEASTRRHTVITCSMA